MKYGFVYLWFDRKHKRYYIGSHWGTEDDGYICSSSWMKASYLRRPFDFKRRIIKRVYENRSSLLQEEHRWLSMIKDEEIKIRYYNLNTKMIQHWWSEEHSRLSIGEKISNSRTGKKYSKRGPRTPEDKAKISNSLKGKGLDRQTIEKIVSKTLGQRWWTDGTVNCKSVNCPGPEWRSGRINHNPYKKNRKSSVQHGEK